MNVNSENKSNTKKQLRCLARLKLAILIVVIYMILNIIGIGCPIKFFTGISCLGCGMTRAVLSAIRLDFYQALYFHPLFFLVPFMFLVYLFEDMIKAHYVKAFWIGVTILFITVYIIRLIYIQNDIVFIDLCEGFVVKFLHNIILGG